MKRRVPRVRSTTVPCPSCGAETTVQVWPALYVLGQRVREAGVLLTVSCARHCGADVPIHGRDVQQAA